MPKTNFAPDKHHKTKNSRGYMHPLSEISRKFVLFAATTTSPVMDIGCAYGNTVIEALKNGAKTVVACDMSSEHLDAIHEQLADTELKDQLVTRKGTFPEDFNFEPNSLAAVHTSHLFEYLSGDKLEEGLEKIFRWLQPGGKLFIICYTVFILELSNKKFRTEYAQRIASGNKWPGYLENFDDYAEVPPPETQGQSSSEEEIEDSPFPAALHMYDLPVLTKTLTAKGFEIESAEYLDGRANGAVEETWNDGRELVGVVAYKPRF